jgi:signal transduction histidine kinase
MSKLGSIGFRLMLLALAALGGLLATALISDRSAREAARSVEKLERTREVLARTHAVSRALAESESDARAYAITGAPAFRTDFEAGAGVLRGAVASLREAVADDTSQRAQATSLDALTARRLKLLSELVANQGADPQKLKAKVFEGEQVTRQISSALQVIRAAELSDAKQETAAAGEALRLAKIAPWAMCSLAAAMLAVMFVPIIGSAAREHEARKHAEDANAMKDRFLATLSHELRTPLTAIIGWCGLLETSRNEPLLSDGLASIREAARTQSTLVEDLLDSSRIAAGRLTLCLETTDLAGVIERAVGEVDIAARAKELSIVKSFQARPRLECDPARLKQVVSNLLGNSVKFSPPGRTIDVTLRTQGSRAQIIVRDEGDGIDSALLPEIFGLFRQGTQSSARHSGLGLGLSIVKSLVELHGGTVRDERGHRQGRNVHGGAAHGWPGA